jgi:hypothetical protein
MGESALSPNPFAVLTFIVAPALLTNASSLLVMSTINRLLRVGERMHELYAESEKMSEYCGSGYLEQVNRTERQAMRLLSALRWIYVALGAFAASSLVALVGAVSGQMDREVVLYVVVGLGLTLGALGVTGLICGCMNLLRANQLSLMNISEEASLIRARHEKRRRESNPAGR